MDSIVIKSDGTPSGTKISTGDGLPIKGVTKVVWSVDVNGCDIQLHFAQTEIKHIEIKKKTVIRMRKWFKVIYTNPAYFGYFFSKGYRLC